MRTWQHCYNKVRLGKKQQQLYILNGLVYKQARGVIFTWDEHNMPPIIFVPYFCNFLTKFSLNCVL